MDTGARTIPALIAAAEAAYGQDPFLLGRDGLAVSFTELLDRTHLVGDILDAHEVPGGGRVLIGLHNGPVMTLVYLGVMAAGRVAVTANPAAGASELEHIMQITGPELAIADPRVVSRWCAHLGDGRVLSTGTIEDLERLGASGPARRQGGTPGVDPAMPAEIVFTSGSTGQPKGAVLSHANLTANSLGLADRFAPDRGDRFLAVSPLFHNSGQIFTTLTPLWAGASTVPVRTDLGLARFGSLVDELAINWTLVVNAFLAVANETGNGPVKRTLKGVLAGGSVLHASVIEAFEHRYGVRVYQVYGLTESTSVSTSEEPGDDERRSVGSAGRPLSHADVSVDESGQILIRGPHVFQGYVSNPSATNERLAPDGALRTGDIGSFDEKGNLHLLDRIDNMLITGGENVYPAEVERVSDALDGVSASIALGVPHATLGDAIVLVYEGDDDLKQQLRVHLERDLSVQKRPRMLLSCHDIGMPAFPRAGNGKLLRTDVERAARTHLQTVVST